jgi:hypothetical protein
MKIIGIDVSRGSVTICPLEVLPRDFKRYRDGVEKLELSSSGIERLLEIGPNGVVLEPTGGHYSKLWASHLRRANISVRWVDHGAVDAYRRSHRCPNKSDLHDAVALACYGIEHWHNEEYFINPTQIELRDFCLQINHLNTLITSTTNRLRQQLHHEWPEVSQLSFTRNQSDTNPLVLQFIANLRITPKWQKSHEQTIGTGLSRFSRMLAAQLCLARDHRNELEAKVGQELERPEYSRYTACLKRAGMNAPKLSAAIICAIYPFERFLEEGRPKREYIKTSSGKRSRRDRSKASFKLACGLGMIWYQSGEKQGFRPGGSADARRAIYLWVRTRIVLTSGRTQHEEETAFIAEMQRYYKQVSGPGNLKCQKVARRVVEKLYREMIKEWSPNTPVI